MKAYLVAHFYLAPFLILTILASFGFPLAGATVGLLTGAVFCAVKYGFKSPSVFMVAQLLGVLGVLLTQLLVPSLKESSAIAVVFAFLAVGAAISLLNQEALDCGIVCRRLR